MIDILQPSAFNLNTRAVTMDVYITDITAFLPNNPVNNEEIEKILGMVDQVSSRIRKIILRKNKIHQRYYAIDPATGLTTHIQTPSLRQKRFAG